MEIRVEVQDVTSVKKRLKVEVPADIAKEEYDQVAGEYRKYARLPGFRPGKAPVELVKRHFHKSIRSDVVQKLIPQSYDQAIREKGIQPLGEPSVENLSFEEGGPLIYEADLEIPPAIELPGYRGLEVRDEVQPVTDEDLEKELEQLRERQARLVSVEGRAVQPGDYAVIDLRGEYLDEDSEPQNHRDTEREHGSTAARQHDIEDEGVVVKVGDEHTHQAFNQALPGMKAADEKTFEVEYPADYPEKKLAGHRVRFTLQVTEVKQQQLPELNDDFAREVGEEYETLAQLKEKIREQLTAQRETNRERELKNRLVQQLMERTQFEVPGVLVEDRIDDLIRDLAYRMAYQGVDPARANVNWVKVRADLRPDAEKQVRSNLLLNEIGRRESIEVAQEELENEIRKLSDSWNQPIEKVRQYFGREERMENLKMQIAREKALQLLLQAARVTTTDS